MCGIEDSKKVLANEYQENYALYLELSENTRWPNVSASAEEAVARVFERIAANVADKKYFLSADGSGRWKHDLDKNGQPRKTPLAAFIKSKFTTKTATTTNSGNASSVDKRRTSEFAAGIWSDLYREEFGRKKQESNDEGVQDNPKDADRQRTKRTTSLDKRDFMAEVTSTVDLAVQSEERKAIDDCLDRLPQGQVEIIVITLFLGRSKEVAAELLGIGAGKVRSEQTKGKENLRRCLKQKNIR